MLFIIDLFLFCPLLSSQIESLQHTGCSKGPLTRKLVNLTEFKTISTSMKMLHSIYWPIFLPSILVFYCPPSTSWNFWSRSCVRFAASSSSYCWKSIVSAEHSQQEANQVRRGLILVCLCTTLKALCGNIYCHLCPLPRCRWITCTSPLCFVHLLRSHLSNGTCVRFDQQPINNLCNANPTSILKCLKRQEHTCTTPFCFVHLWGSPLWNCIQSWRTWCSEEEKWGISL